MHPNQAFRKTTREKNIEFVRERSFGVLAVNAENAPLISHIPIRLSSDGSYIEAHLVRSNPIVRLCKSPLEAVIAVSGGDAYVSPDWYGVDNQVPTWNYVAVHIRGTLRQLDHQDLRGILDRLSETMESRLAPKKPWTIDKMEKDIFLHMSKQIVPIAMDVTDIQGTWKLSQNKPLEVRDRATIGVKAGRIGAEVDELARLMELPDDG